MKKMPDNDLDRWMKFAEWRGRTVQALEGINNELTGIKKDINDIKNQNNKRDYRTAYIAGGMSIIMVIFAYIVQNMIA